MEITDIPNAMDNMGWKIAPQLMRRWLRTGRYVMPRIRRGGKDQPIVYTPLEYDDQTIKIDWVLQYNRALSAYMSARYAWNNPDAITELRKNLLKKGWVAGRRMAVPLGNTSYSARLLDAFCAVNFRAFGSKSDTIDDLSGALGAAIFKSAIVGSTSTDAMGRDIFIATDIGIYIRDTYDFTDWKEPLGVWSKDRCLNKAETSAYFAGMMPGSPSNASYLRYKTEGFEAIFNNDFNKWRSKTGKGGDFIIYSDIKWFPAYNTVVRL